MVKPSTDAWQSLKKQSALLLYPYTAERRDVLGNTSLTDSALAFLEVLSALFILRDIPAIFLFTSKQFFGKRVNNVMNVH